MELLGRTLFQLSFLLSSVSLSKSRQIYNDAPFDSAAISRSPVFYPLGGCICTVITYGITDAVLRNESGHELGAVFQTNLDDTDPIKVIQKEAPCESSPTDLCKILIISAKQENLYHGEFMVLLGDSETIVKYGPSNLSYQGESDNANVTITDTDSEITLELRTTKIGNSFYACERTDNAWTLSLKFSIPSLSVFAGCNLGTEGGLFSVPFNVQVAYSGLFPFRSLDVLITSSSTCAPPSDDTISIILHISGELEQPESPTILEQSIGLSTIIAIAVPTAIITIVAPLLGIGLCLCCIRIYKQKAHRIYKQKARRFYKRKTCRRNTMLTNPADDKREVDVAETSFLTQQESLLQNLPESLIIHPSKIQVSTVIGQGQFGVVYKGYLKPNVMDTVAIKTLKGIFATASDIESVFKEIEKMQHFKHLNVISLIGVCMAPSEQVGSTGGPCIVMPFMANGNLLEQLRKESDELNVTSEDDKNFGNVKKILLQMCLQIAKGMEYLAGQKFVHRDLAARNCLVDAKGIVKVSDFGLAEEIYSQNYFRQVKGGTKLPLKWMALESITQGKFTEKSDVWSYGITCWEVFTGGSMPYLGMHPLEVLDFLENGERSARPKNAACDSHMYEMMQSCWEHKDTSRPSFSDIVSYLTSNLEYTSDYLDFTGLTNGPPMIKPNADCSEDGTNDSVSKLHSVPLTPSMADNYYITI